EPIWEQIKPIFGDALRLRFREHPRSNGGNHVKPPQQPRLNRRRKTAPSAQLSEIISQVDFEVLNVHTCSCPGQTRGYDRREGIENRGSDYHHHIRRPKRFCDECRNARYQKARSVKNSPEPAWTPRQPNRTPTHAHSAQ